MATAAADLRARVERAWLPFRAAVTEMDRRTNAGWTVKEMVAHVAFWDEAVVPVVVTMFRGEQLPAGWAFGSGDLGLADGPWPPPDVHNAREAAWARGRSAVKVLERCDQAHARLVALLATLTDAEVEANADYFGGLGDHYAEHLAELAGGEAAGEGHA